MSLDVVFNNLITIKMDNNSNSNNQLSQSKIENCIITIRGQQVIMDRDLAIFYGVETKSLNQAVKRKRERS